MLYDSLLLLLCYCSTPPIVSLNAWHIVTAEYSSSSGSVLLEIDGFQFINQETWVGLTYFVVTALVQISQILKFVVSVLLSMLSIMYKNSADSVSRHCTVYCISDASTVRFLSALCTTQTSGEPVLLQSGVIFVGRIPSNQVDDHAPKALATGFIGCIERVSDFSIIVRLMFLIFESET